MSISAVFAGELILSKVVASQRARLAAALPEAVDTILSGARAVGHQRLRDAYGYLVETVRVEQEAWLRVERQALRVPGSGAELAEIGRGLAEVERLAADLRSSGEGESHDRR